MDDPGVIMYGTSVGGSPVPVLMDIQYTDSGVCVCVFSL